MGLETGNFITDLVATNPPGSDTKSQGDDHIRLLKAVLQGSFPSASKAWYNPTVISKVADFNVLATEMNRTFYIDPTAGAMTATLPVLASSDAGWECHFVKIGTSTNSFWIAPPSGNILVGDLTIAKTRRVIPGIRTTAYWAGASWLATRAVTVPVGTVLDFDGATLPVGFEWPNGQTLAGASGSVYPDYFARKGSLLTRDLRGKTVFCRDDIGGPPAGLITNAGSGIVGTTLGATGGLESTIQLQSDIPNQTLNVTVTGNLISGVVNISNQSQFTSNAQPAGAGFNTYSVGGSSLGFTGALANTALTGTGVTSSLNGGVAQTAMRNMPPAIIMNKILVVE